MKCTFQASAEITLEHKEGSTKSSLTETNFALQVDEIVQEQHYLQDGYPTKDGCHVISVCFVSGLISNIAYADKSGFKNRQEHFDYIISELKRTFEAEPKNIYKSTFRL